MGCQRLTNCPYLSPVWKQLGRCDEDLVRTPVIWFVKCTVLFGNEISSLGTFFDGPFLIAYCLADFGGHKVFMSCMFSTRGVEN